MPTAMVGHPDNKETSKSLGSPAENAVWYGRLAGSKSLGEIGAIAQCTFPSGYRLVRVDQPPGSDGFEIALINDQGRSVAYYTRVVICEWRGREATTSLHWRSPDARHAMALRGIAQKVLFQYLLPRSDILVPASLLLGESRLFWVRQLSAAIALGHEVYSQPSRIDEAPSVTSQESLEDLTGRLWSSNDKTYAAVIRRSDR